MANWAWPEITDEESARSAAHMAGGWAAAVTGLTTLLVVINMLSSSRILGIGPSALLDAALFGIVAWRVWNGSRPWAIAGLSLYALEIAWNVVHNPPGIGILTIIILLALINGVRGTFRLHAYMEAGRPQPQVMMQAAPHGTFMPTTSTPPPPKLPEQYS